MTTYPKPILKWAGGKNKLLSKIIKYIPSEMNNYHEIFLGGGSVLLAVLYLQKIQKIQIKNKIFAYDINKTLINVYKNLQNKPVQLCETVNVYLSKYNDIKCMKSLKKYKKSVVTEKNKFDSKENYYYHIRTKFNIKKHVDSIECAALFMFLNKTCFRGLHRVGPNGFNVPFGHYKKIRNVSSSHILEISKLIEKVEFSCDDFEVSMKKIKKSDFVYLDPPYAPINDKSFVSYNKKKFDLNKHNILFKCILELHQNNIHFLMSNAKVPMVLEYFKDFEYEIIIARRRINSKNPESKTSEVLIYNN